jgi:L-aminopeptidase/D-esterase-like protein
MTSEGSLTQVAGLSVGHAEVPGGGSGCTVVLGPFRGAVELSGLATGSRELDPFAEDHLVPTVDALLLTGGSAFGLAAAQGVVDWLEERGRGFETPAGRVPIVPAAVLYDLAAGRARPGPAEGRRACENATNGPVGEGRIGAGAGASVGKLLGRERASPGGIGSASRRVGRWVLGALAAVNAVGDVVDRSGRIVAGARDGDRFLDGARALLSEGERLGEVAPDEPGIGENTTLAVVATDAPLGASDLRRVARLATTALARRISPVHTPFDGDLVFALSTSPEVEPMTPREVMILGMAGREALETAILRSVGA